LPLFLYLELWVHLVLHKGTDQQKQSVANQDVSCYQHLNKEECPNCKCVVINCAYCLVLVVNAISALSGFDQAVDLCHHSDNFKGSICKIVIGFNHQEYRQNYQQVQVVSHNYDHSIFAHLVHVHTTYR
jgi:hypothetical protein